MAESAPGAAERTRKASGRKETPKAQATRMQILTAAARAFSARGYGLTRLADIASAADLHLTALYYYYDSKEALATDLLIHVSTRNSQALNAAIAHLPADASHRMRIETAIDAHLRAVLHQDDFMAAYRAIVGEVSREARERVLPIHRRDGEVWRELIDQAIAAGEIRAGTDGAMARMALIGAMNWAIEWFDPAKDRPDRLVAALQALFFDGVA